MSYDQSVIGDFRLKAKEKGLPLTEEALSLRSNLEDSGIGWVVLHINTDVVEVRESGFIELWFADYSSKGVSGKIGFLENFFADPFNATQEEVELFKLEHEWNYPKKLMREVV